MPNVEFTHTPLQPNVLDELRLSINANIGRTQLTTRTALQQLFHRQPTEEIIRHHQEAVDVPGFQTTLLSAGAQQLSQAIRQEIVNTVTTPLRGLDFHGDTFDRGVDAINQNLNRPGQPQPTPTPTPTRTPPTQTPTGFWGKLWKNPWVSVPVTVGATTGVATASVAAGMKLAEVPVLGKIATGIGSGITAVSNYLTPITSALGVPAGVVSPLVLAGLGVPAALWGLGHLKRGIVSSYTGKEKPKLDGFWQNLTTPVWDGVKMTGTVLSSPIWAPALGAGWVLGKTPGAISKTLSTVIGTPVKAVWNEVAETFKNRKLATVGGLALGAFASSFFPGSLLATWLLTGGIGGNLLRRSNLKSTGGGAAAPAPH
ncbi:MAG: hypothetical protein Q7R81_05460 [Candidatus Peregrinibacteria bacterium]|nr:hypothetical protein [Candidatus Peregrinibacteria bacterium]